eukprot:3242332-Pleurochrysis_carterae.AAC.1
MPSPVPACIAIGTFAKVTDLLLANYATASHEKHQAGGAGTALKARVAGILVPAHRRGAAEQLHSWPER